MKKWTEDQTRRYMAGRDPQMIPSYPKPSVISPPPFSQGEEIYWVESSFRNHYDKVIKTRVRVKYLGNSIIDGELKARVMKLDGSRDTIRVSFDDLEKTG